MSDETRIRSREELEAWLRGPPAPEALALSVRAALRVLPLVAAAAPDAGFSVETKDYRAALAQMFRFISSAFVIAALPDAKAKVADALNSSRQMNHFILRGEYLSQGAAAVFRTVEAAAWLAIGEFDSRLQASGAGFCVSTAVDAVMASSNPEAEVNQLSLERDDRDRQAFIHVQAQEKCWGEVSFDAQIARVHNILHLITSRPLWNLTDVSDMLVKPRWFVESWRELRAAAPTNEDWDVWFDWYEDRIAGRFRGAEHEMVFASVSNDIWAQGPAAANRWIKEHLPKAAPGAASEQDPAGGRIAIGADGRARLAPSAGDTSDAAAARNPITRQLHESVKQSLGLARERLHRLGNLPGFENIVATIDDIDKYLSVDTAMIADNIATVWALNAAIGTFIERDDLARDGRGGLTEPLDPAPREALDQLFTRAAPFIRQFPSARALDDHVREAKSAAGGVEASRRIVAEATVEGVLDEELENILAVEIEAGKRSAGFQGEKTRAWLIATVRNLLVSAALFVATPAALTSGDNFPRLRQFLARVAEEARDVFAGLDKLSPHAPMSAPPQATNGASVTTDPSAKSGALARLRKLRERLRAENTTFSKEDILSLRDEGRR
jgi:hypothetical protein